MTTRITDEQLDKYNLSVDYGRSVEDGVKAGCYDDSDPSINSHNFSTNRKGTAEVTMEIIDLGGDITTDKALRKLDLMGYRPAELHELLAFGEEYPDVQREVVALGSVWNLKVPSIICLPALGPGRELGLLSMKSGWYNYEFAAIHKHK